MITIKYRLVQYTTLSKDGKYLETYKIQKNYGRIIPDWHDIPEEEYKDKNEALNQLDTITKNKTTKYQYKIIKEVKT